MKMLSLSIKNVKKNTENYSIEPWSYEELLGNQALTAIISERVIANKRSNNGIRKAARILQNSLMCNEIKSEGHNCVLTSGCKNISSENSEHPDATKLKELIKNIRAVKSESSTLPTATKNFIFNKSPMKREEQDRKLKLFDLFKIASNAVESKAVSPVSAKPRSLKSSNKSLEALADKCAGIKKEQPKVVLVSVATKARIETYLEIKTVLTRLFGFKFHEFAGITKADDGSFSFLVEDEAYERYLNNPQYSRAGKLYSWSVKDVQACVPTVALICDKAAKNSNAAPIRRAAKELFSASNGKNSIEVEKFISDHGDRSFNVPVNQL